MVHFSALGLLATAASLVSAVPTNLDTRAAAAAAAGGCSFSGAAGFAKIAKSKASCSVITLTNIVVPAGQTLDLTGLKSGTKVNFVGSTTFGYEEWSGPLISVSGTNLAISGAAGNCIDGGGARWWDGKGSNGGKTKPKFFFAHNMISSTISGLNFKNSPVQLMSINGCTNLAISNINFDNSAGDAGNIGHNTDAFDIGSSTNVSITNCTVHNQDDCLAVNSGTGITFTGNICIGGHGISLGSVGGRSDNTVKNVNIINSTVKNSDNGLRVKTISGATGLVSGVTYRNITLSNIAKVGIVIQQDYLNGSPTGKPTNGVKISGVTFTGVTGSLAGSAERLKILCGPGSCSSFSMAGVNLTGGKTCTTCVNVPNGLKC